MNASGSPALINLGQKLRSLREIWLDLHFDGSILHLFSEL